MKEEDWLVNSIERAEEDTSWNTDFQIQYLDLDDLRNTNLGILLEKDL